MKCSILLTLFVAAAAQDGDGSQGAASQGAQGSDSSEGADSGYGDAPAAAEQPEAYGQEAAPEASYAAPEASYAHESYHAAAAVDYFRPKVCVGLCPEEAPFWNIATGGCSPGICRQEIPYQHEEASYEAQQSYGGEAQSGGYRRLGDDSQGSDSQGSDSQGAQGGESDNSYGYEAPAQAAPAAESYAAPQAESYAAPQAESYAAPQAESYAPQESSCNRRLQENVVAPRNSIDTRNNRVGNAGRIALWIGFIILFFHSVYFVNRYLWYYYCADMSDGVKDWRIGSSSGLAIFQFLASPALMCGFVTFIASLAYLSMATHHGFYVRCFDGREFYYARYLDWIITTPMMLHALAHFGDMTDNIWHYLFFNDILMIASGLIGSTVGGGDRWAFFAFSVLCFLPVIYYLCNLKNAVIDNRMFTGTGAVMDAALAIAAIENGNFGAAFRPALFFFGTYDSIMRLTVLAWSMYPIVWILAEGTGTLSANAEAILYTILDIVSKACFGIIVVTAKKNSFQDLLTQGFKMLDPTLDFTAVQIQAALVTSTIVDSGSSSL